MLNVANWSDKQLDELIDLLRTADFSAVASFISENFLCGLGESHIMDDDLQTTMRVTVGVPVTTVNLSAGVFQHGGKVSQIDSAQLINILDPTGPGAWGPGKAANPGAARYSIVSVKWDEQFHTVEQRWFVDDTVQPNIYSQQQTLTLINKAYYNIVVTHGADGGGIPATPTGYFTIAEIYIPAGCTDLSTATIRDTADIPPFYTSANWDVDTRIRRMQFFSSLFAVDHNPSTGYHKNYTGTPGTGFHIGATEVQASAAELNKLYGTGATVNAANLNSLTNGSNIGTSLHTHGIILLEYALLQDVKASGNSGGDFQKNAWRTRILNTKPYDDIGINLSGNQFTLPVGTYQIEATCPAVSVKQHKARLQRVAPVAATVLLGSSESSGASSDPDGGSSRITGRFDVTTIGGETFEIQHYCLYTNAVDGFGRTTNIPGVNEVYTQVAITKIA